MNLEIERKFLLKSIPDEEPIEKIKIDQWYLKKGNTWTVRVGLYPPESQIDLSGNRWFSNNVQYIDDAIYDAQDNPAVGGTVQVLPIIQHLGTTRRTWGTTKTLYR